MKLTPGLNIIVSNSWGLIGIGGSLAAPPLPHHRTYGSRIRRFGKVSQLTSSTGRLLPMSQPWFHPLPSRVARMLSRMRYLVWLCRRPSPLPFGPSSQRTTMPSADFSPLVKKHYYSFSQFPSRATVRGKREISRGKTQNLPCLDAGFIKHTPIADGGLCLHVPTRPECTTSRLQRDSCSSPRSFGLSFLQTPPRGDVLALLLAFGSAKTWHGDSHPISSVPCPAHTSRVSGAR